MVATHRDTKCLPQVASSGSGAAEAAPLRAADASASAQVPRPAPRRRRLPTAGDVGAFRACVGHRRRGQHPMSPTPGPPTTELRGGGAEGKTTQRSRSEAQKTASPPSEGESWWRSAAGTSQKSGGGSRQGTPTLRTVPRGAAATTRPEEDGRARFPEQRSSTSASKAEDSWWKGRSGRASARSKGATAEHSVLFSICACHRCARAMLIFSISFRNLHCATAGMAPLPLPQRAASVGVNEPASSWPR